MSNFLLNAYSHYKETVHFSFFIIGTLVGAGILTFLFQRLIHKWTIKTHNKLDDYLSSILSPLFFGSLVLGGFYMAFIQLTFIQKHQLIFHAVIKIALIVLLVIVFLRILSVIFSWINHKSELKKQQKGFMLALEKILNVLVYFLGLLFVLDTAGISITPLIASLGIGGLAVSLALQPTLSNYFAGLYLAADTFLQLNDYIKMPGGVEGVIVQIGARNTAIRTWNNNLVIVPNAQMANSVVTNLSEPNETFTFAIDCMVAYNSDLEKVEKIALTVAKNIQEKEAENATQDYVPKVSFRAFGVSNIEFKVFMQANSYVAHYGLRHQFIKAIKVAFEKEGIRIAVPGQSVELLSELSRGA